MIRKLFACCKCRRRSACLFPLVAWLVLTLVTFCWLGDVTRALLPPPPLDQNLDHFRRSRDLTHYLDNIKLLIEPSSVCEADPPLVILVSSVASHVEHRQAIRNTWGKHQPTYFVLGVENQNINENLVDNYVEAKQHSDLIVYDLQDHYQNLTLKTLLMMQWTLDRCPRVKHLMKTDDDVLVNPWTLKVVLEENHGAILLGYKLSNSKLHRDEYNKWFVPRWLSTADHIPEYLSGTGYLIDGSYIKKIFNAAKSVPLVNLEDVYLTYLVSKSKLNLELVHDKRLSPFKPWIPVDCAYWSLASVHSLVPDEIAHAWEKLERKGKLYEKGSEVCQFYKSNIENEIFLA